MIEEPIIYLLIGGFFYCVVGMIVLFIMTHRVSSKGEKVERSFLFKFFSIYLGLFAFISWFILPLPWWLILVIFISSQISAFSVYLYLSLPPFSKFFK